MTSVPILIGGAAGATGSSPGALILSRLAQVISERKVQGGLRRVLLTQAKRLRWLASRRFEALGGAASVEAEGEED